MCSLPGAHPTDNLFLVSGNRLTRAMTDVTTEFIIRETLEKAVINSNSKLTKTWIDLDELCKKIFEDLQCHAFSGTEEEDVIDHIADFLKILDQIKTTIFNTNQLRINIFPLFLSLSLTEDAKIWWLNVRTIKSQLEECLPEGIRWGINYFEDDTVSTDEEWEEHEYGNPPNNSLPKSHLNTNDKRDTKYHKENNRDINKSSDMVLSGAPHCEE
ncbi:hypothetical protein Tco_0188829 [Tanacetum coccineum]